MKSFKEIYTKHRTRYMLTPDDKGDWFVYEGKWSCDANKYLSLSKYLFTNLDIISYDSLCI